MVHTRSPGFYDKSIAGRVSVWGSKNFDVNQNCPDELSVEIRASFIFA
jgi:hypothetical protein